MICGHGHAALTCASVPITTSFGTNSSFTYASNAQNIISGSGLTCSGGSILSIGAAEHFDAIINLPSTNGTLRLTNSTTNDYIPYTIHCPTQEVACVTTSSASMQTFSWNYSTTDLLGLLKGPDKTLPVYMQTATNINVPAGIYTDTLTINWNYNLCDGIGINLGITLCTKPVTGKISSTITVTATVTNDCYIDNAPDVNFGSAPLPAQFQTINSALSVRCTKNASYKVNMTSSNPAKGDWRQMQDITGQHTLLYQLYRSDNTLWTNTNDLSQMGNGESQPINYIARINPAQENLPAGIYSDKVIVTVTY